MADTVTTFGTAVLTADQFTVAAQDLSLLEAIGYNAGAANGYLQTHNKGAPVVLGDVPVHVLPVSLDASFSLDFRNEPWRFSAGLVFALSTTGPTFTPGGLLLWVTGRALL